MKLLLQILRSTLYFHSIFSCCLLLPQFILFIVNQRELKGVRSKQIKKLSVYKKKRSEHRAAKKNTEKKETENPKKICLR